MTLVLESDATESMTLEAFIEHAERELDVHDVDSLAAAGPAFKCLLNNGRLLPDFIDGQLRNWRARRDDHEYVGHTIVLARRPHFLIRANIWVAPDRSKPLPRRDDPSFGYLYPHDHNFAFLTGGYHGPGYETVLFEYDDARVTGLPGESVDVRARGRARLPLGAMMLYEPSRDIHYQEHPAELSISLNVVVPGRYSERAQYLFDVEQGRIDVALTPNSTCGMTLCSLAAELGDDETMDLLASVARSDADARVRVAAAKAVGGEVLEELLGGSDVRIRELAGL